MVRHLPRLQGRCEPSGTSHSQHVHLLQCEQATGTNRGSVRQSFVHELSWTALWTQIWSCPNHCRSIFLEKASHGFLQFPSPIWDSDPPSWVTSIPFQEGTRWQKWGHMHYAPMPHHIWRCHETEDQSPYGFDFADPKPVIPLVNGYQIPNVWSLPSGRNHGG